MNTVNDAWLQAADQGVLRLITAGSVDDGKSTLIGRLLVDSQGVFADQIAAIQRSKYKRGEDAEPDLALLTDGLEAEREQGITIDVAYRYFATPKRKFIVADTPGHEQYTRNMITGASTAQAAIILIDAHRAKDGELLTQTKRHSTVGKLLGLRHIVVAVNKMDLVDWDQAVFDRIHEAYRQLATQLGIEHFHIIPLSALKGENITQASPHTPWYQGLPLLPLLESLDLRENIQRPARLFVQWVARHGGSSADSFRGYAGQLSGGRIQVGDSVQVWPSGKTAVITQLFRAGTEQVSVSDGDAVTVVLDRELDISRGDLLTLAHEAISTSKHFDAQLCWLDEQALNTTRSYWLKQGTRLTQAKVQAVHALRDVHSLQEQQATGTLSLNDIGRASLVSRDPLVLDDYQDHSSTGSFILIDPSTNQTVAAGLVQKRV
ncbi:sulfate adenylyltransferase [Alcaligenes faecalis]|uniref:sulfate adenylyltransferase subunit 1 n=1 Tax=Alcaligenes faecalis TaxID=511 RepID=UPI000A2DD6CA|nr:GTP-binding protein [Alcaligenes faecalis]KAA1283999.1 sulfate adenylyltransferase [Alcaligenes faecalis]OSZ31983.1 sulfate adenylyltransferase [Alcaligenes faecalis]OSZ39942.1 sulfate adenylyltransferase [Alcaligenes faecalis]